jgi:6-pyruvoyltetrahydropterin/6-carboxytetrahydropterin synthase
MKTTISKEFRFEAAHSLPHLGPDHPCSREHGHSYRFVVHVTGPINPDRGWVIDYADIADVVNRFVVNRLDHRNINAFVVPSTAEMLAQWIWKEINPLLPGLCCVEIYETATSCVRLEA